jgi:hypothetical protein
MEARGITLYNEVLVILKEISIFPTLCVRIVAMRNKK